MSLKDLSSLMTPLFTRTTFIYSIKSRSLILFNLVIINIGDHTTIIQIYVPPRAVTFPRWGDCVPHWPG